MFLEVTQDMGSLVSQLKNRGTIKSTHIEEAFGKVDRKNFVPLDCQDIAYLDQAIQIGSSQTISQPTTIAFMLELLNPRKGDHILEIGGGSGWLAALLSVLVGHEGSVISAEILESVYQFGQNNLSKYAFSQLKFIHQDASHGLPEFAPYDKIIGSAAFFNVPDQLFEQLKPEGVMVVPTANYTIDRYRKNANGEVNRETFEGFIFVPITGKVREVAK